MAKLTKKDRQEVERVRESVLEIVEDIIDEYIRADDVTYFYVDKILRTIGYIVSPNQSLPSVEHKYWSDTEGGWHSEPGGIKYDYAQQDMLNANFKRCINIEEYKEIKDDP